MEKGGTHIIKVLHVEGLLETGPLVEGEEAAEHAGADIGCLICTDALHGIGVVDVKGEAGRGVLVHASSRILQVAGNVGEEIVITNVADGVIIVVVARIVLMDFVSIVVACGSQDSPDELTDASVLFSVPPVYTLVVSTSCAQSEVTYPQG